MRILHSVYYAYIVQCADGTFYTGKTNNLNHRIKQHNGLLSGGAKYTETRRPVILVHFEKCPTNTFACQREAEIKKLTRQKKMQLIEGKNF
ncbi:MAG TPA: GIY-YIG nuclease family protein [Candidatus Saccharimonadales bacterium]|nr:GIY-YIG nuclease family protein [Candidatus Saccharimonadales bacterium]